MSDNVADPLRDAFEDVELRDLLKEKEQYDLTAKAGALGLDYGAALPQGILHLLTIPEFYKPSNIFTKEGRAEGLENLMTGIDKLSRGDSGLSKVIRKSPFAEYFPEDGYYSPGKALADYDELDYDDRITAEGMALYTDPTNLALLGIPSFLRKKTQQKIGKTILQEGMEEGVNAMQPGLAFAGGVAGGKATTKIPSIQDFWERVSDPEIGLTRYQGQKLEDLSRVDKRNLTAKYERFAEKNISIDDIIITADKKRLIYPETYTTKSPYPYARTSTDKEGFDRVRTVVDFSHIKNGAKLEKKFDEMVREFYKYPMNSRSLPDNLTIQNFGRIFFGGEKTEEYVSNIVSAYARANNITRPVVGTDKASAIKSALRRDDIKQNGDYFFENLIRGNDEINLHHSATIKKPYSADDLMYIDSFVNQQTLETFEIKRNKLLKKQKTLLNKYLETPNAENKKALNELNNELLDVIGNNDTYGLLSAPLANFKGSQVYLSEFRFTSPNLKLLNSTGIFEGKNIKDLDLIEKVILEFNRPLKKVKVDNGRVTNQLTDRGGKLITNKEFIANMPNTQVLADGRMRNTIDGPLDASIDYLVKLTSVKKDPFLRSVLKNYLEKNPDKNTIDAMKEIKEYVKEQAVRKMVDFGVVQAYYRGGPVRQPFAPENENRVAGFNFFVDDISETGTAKQAIEDTRKFYFEPTLMSLKKQREETIKNIKLKAREELRNERPVKFKASELANLAEEFVFKPSGTLMTAPLVGALNSIEYVYNAARAGTENDIDMKTKFPNVYKLFDYYTSGIGPTPDDQTYIGFIDETIRSVQKGGQNLGYSTLDLAFLLPDLAFDTRLQERLKKAYDENAFADPETFLGDAGAILTEFGVPSGLALKFINFMRRGLQAKTGINLFTKSSDDLAGMAKRVNQFSNVAKRVGVVAGTSFLGEFAGGSRYSTLRRMNPEDPLFLDQTLGYDFIDTTGMSGRELTVAELQNRFRFGAEGAIIGGMFPLIGPPLAKITKYGVIKPSAYVAGKGLQAANYLAIKPVSYLLARTPIVAEIGQGAAALTGMGARFLGKDVLSRAAIGFLGTPTLRQLPEFKKWRMFEVTSSDPLERNLKKFDNFLSLFRDTANQSANRFFISGQTERGIKAISRKVEKQLDIVERRAYDLARGFLRDYNSKTTSPAKQEYYLDQVMMYLKGQIKNSDLPEQLQGPAKELNKTFMKIKSEFADILPDGAGLKDFLNTNLRQYMRASFSTFTNPFYKPDKTTFNRAVNYMVDRINRNESMVDAAIAAAKPGVSTDAAIKDFARKQVESILQRGKVDNRDPLDVLAYIARNNLKLDDLTIQTGEELPKVIRELLGQENSLRTSIMTTATDLASQTSNFQMYEKLADLGIKEGWLFRSAEEAIAAGVVDPKVIGPRLPGLGKLNSKISETYGGEDIVNSIVGTTGLLDNMLKNEIYQGLIAYKAMVQSGKTVYSPATQTRNFGSAAFFPLQSGHIGGSASVQDAFKIMLDDIFGAGKTVNEQDLIDRITRKIELGVLDENVVVSELKDILKDLKSSKFKSLSALTERVDKTKISDTATRLYAGGDNVWKWYGHEFVMSQIKNGFKNVDELVEQYKKVFKTDINPATLEEGIEQYAATLIRETYPTYSKVPKLIQLIRRIPFVGNFVSFPAEILRTTFTTSALAAKHIASDNATLRELGYRTLMGQFITYGGIGAGLNHIGHAMTNVTTQQIDDIKQYFAPEFMRFSDLVPITNIDKGVVKVFDNSRYFPYDLITSTVGNLMTRMFTQKEQLDPDKIETDMFKDIYNYTGPFADLAGGTLLGTAIGYEPALTFLTGGRTKTGSRIYSDTDTSVEKFDKMFAYTFETINPGFIRTAQNMYKSFAGMLTGTGQPIKPEDEIFKLFGGSAVTIDVPGSFRYQVSNLKSSFREPKVAEDFFRPDFRNSDQLDREYNDMNEEAFREQYEFYKIVRAALRSDLMSRNEIRKILEDRVGKTTTMNILMGKFTPLTYSKDALESRYENVRRGNPDEILNRFEFLPFPKLDNTKRKWERMRFEDYERKLKEPEVDQDKPQAKRLLPTKAPRESIAENVNPVPDTGTPSVSPVANNVNPTTGLTTTETALLSPGDQAIRQKQRVTGVV